MSIMEVIESRRKIYHLTLQEIADACGVTRITLYRWGNGSIKKIPEEKLKCLAEVLHTSIDHLLGEESESVYKPILGVVKAGYGMYAEQNISGYYPLSYEDRKKGDFVLMVRGDSMIQAGIPDGSYVLVQATPSLENGQIGVVLIEDEVTIKRVWQRPGKGILLEAANPAVADRLFTGAQVAQLHIIGRVSKVFLDL